MQTSAKADEMPVTTEPAQTASSDAQPATSEPVVAEPAETEPAATSKSKKRTYDDMMRSTAHNI